MLSSPAARAPRWVRLRLALLVVLLGAGVVLAARVPVPEGGALVDRAAGWGPWAPWAFAALYAVATLALLPKGVLSAVAGLLFGLGPGALVVWGGAVVGAAAAFWLGRVLGRDAVARLTRGRLRRLDEELTRRGAWAVLLLRLVPLMPFTAVNYGSGLSAVRFPGYLLATAVGIVPGTLAYVALGAYGSDAVHGASPGFVVAVTALVALTVAGVLVARRRGGSARGGGPGGGGPRGDRSGGGAREAGERDGGGAQDDGAQTARDAGGRDGAAHDPARPDAGARAGRWR